MKVCLLGLLALASSAWAKDSTVVNKGKGKGSNRTYNYNHKRKLKALDSYYSQSTSSKSAKSGGCDPTDHGYLLEKAMKLQQISKKVVQEFGEFVPPETDIDEYPWEDFWALKVNSTGAQALEVTMPGLELNDLDGDGFYDKNEVTVALNTYLGDECVDDYYGDIGSIARSGTCDSGCWEKFFVCQNGAELVQCHDDYFQCTNQCAINDLPWRFRVGRTVPV